MPLLTCAHCGNVFKADSSQRKFCSNACRYAGSKRRQSNAKMTYICQGCGKEIPGFTWYPRRFCSYTCKYANYSKPSHPITVTCANCGVIFKKYPGAAQLKAQNHFCCKKCHDDWQGNGNHPTGELSPSYRSIKVKCAYCSTELIRQPWQVHGYTHQFCNGHCHGKWRSQNMTGPHSTAWKGGKLPYYGPNWIEQRDAALDRDSHRCQHCGKPERKNGRKLDVHHIKPFRAFGYIVGKNDAYLKANVPTNLISLCRHCHRKLEHGRISVQLRLF